MVCNILHHFIILTHLSLKLSKPVNPYSNLLDSFGFHSCFLLSSPHLLIGTSRGTLLIYSITPSITLTRTLSSGFEVGRVSSIAVSSSSFIAGCEYGDLLIYGKGGGLTRRIEKMSSAPIIHLQFYGGGPDAVIAADSKCNAWVIILSNGNVERIHDSKIRSTIFDLRVNTSYFAYDLLNLFVELLHRTKLLYSKTLRWYFDLLGRVLCKALF